MKITWRDIHNSDKVDMIDTRRYETVGRSGLFREIECPFCLACNLIQTDSLKGTGKRCTCGYMFDHTGKAYAFKERAT
jgi:hypothetical protein